MSVRNILVPVRGDGKHEALLDHALVLAKRFNAHIDVVHCRPRAEDMMPFGVVVPDSVRKQLASSATTSADDDEKKLRQAFDFYCDMHCLPIVDRHEAPTDKVTASWREESGKQPNVVARLGRLTDVIVVARADRKRNLGYGTLEAGLFETGHIVLMCPPAKAPDIGEHVAIGWNGSAVAARAVAIAMPILQAVSKVTLLAVNADPSAPEGAGDLALYLKSHHIATTVRSARVDVQHVGRALLDEAKAAGADSLLIGAYGQNRIRELVMGGATRHLIDHADLPVFMTH